MSEPTYSQYIRVNPESAMGILRRLSASMDEDSVKDSTFFAFTSPLQMLDESNLSTKFYDWETINPQIEKTALQRHLCK